MGKWAGMIAGGIAGFGRAVEEVAGRRLLDIAQSERDERLAALEREKQANESALREGVSIRAEERKRAPFADALAATGRWKTENTSYDEASGTPVKQEPDEFSTNRRMRQELLSRGEHTAAHELGTEALTAERLNVEKAGIERRNTQEERQHQERMATLQKQLNVQERMLARQLAADGVERDTSTALAKNARLLADSGLVPDLKSGLKMLLGYKQKNDQDAVLQLTNSLLRTPAYFGKDGHKKAMETAKEMIWNLRGLEDGGAGSPDATPTDRRPLDAFMGQ